MAKKFDEQTLASINELGRQFSDATIVMHEAIARKAGLSGTDHKYLGILVQHGEMTAGELAQRTGLTTGAITGLIDRLEKKELVKRKLDKEDRRKVVIVPDVEKASNLLGGIFADLQSKVLTLMSQFDDKEMEIIEKYLLATIQLMQDIAKSLHEEN